MDVAAEPTRNLSTRSNGRSASRIWSIALAVFFAALAGNCFLKYVWWTACHTAWAGIPKLAAQWQAAGVRSTFYGWTLLFLEIAGVIAFFVGIRSRSGSAVGSALRLVLSLIITAAVTGLFAWILSLVNQGFH